MSLKKPSKSHKKEKKKRFEINLKGTQRFTKFVIEECSFDNKYHDCQCNTTYNCKECGKIAIYNNKERALCINCFEKIKIIDGSINAEYKSYTRIYYDHSLDNLIKSRKIKKIIRSLENEEYNDRMDECGYDEIIPTEILTSDNIKHILRRYCCHLIKPIQAIKFKINLPNDFEFFDIKNKRYY